MNSSADLSADVVVVGARVAGAATALLLARAGHDVVMVDRVRQPADTMSTHAFARGGVVQLARFGLLDAVLDSGAPAVREVSFHTADGVIRRTVADTAGVDLLVAPRRHILDPILVDAAVDAGARLIDGFAVRELVRNDLGRVVGVTGDGPDGTRTIRARHVVGADGMRSTVARQVAAPVLDARPSPSGTQYLYVRDLDATGFEFHVGGSGVGGTGVGGVGFAGVFPTHDREACVFLCAPREWSATIRGDREARTQELLRQWGRVSPSLVDRIGRAEITTPVRSAIGLPNHVRRGAGPGWWLVGDAGYHRDPITGHGMTDALHHAELLADALHDVLSDEVSEGAAAVDYECRRRRALAPVFDLTCALIEYPPVEQFLALQKQLSRALEDEAMELAARGDRPWATRTIAAA